jgi:hypothetical protein
MDGRSDIREEYEPHWVWAAAFVLAPLLLTAVAFMGIWPQAVIPLAVAAYAPRVAVFLSLCGVAAAAVRRRRLAFEITAAGLAISTAGYLLLVWLQRG